MKLIFLTLISSIASIPLERRQTVVDGVDTVVENIDPGLEPVLGSVTGVEQALGTAVPLVGDLLDLLNASGIGKRDIANSPTRTKRQTTIVDGIDTVLENIDPALGPVLDSVTGVEQALGTAVPLVGDLLDFLDVSGIGK